MTQIVRNATRILRGVFIFRLFITLFGVAVFSIRWSPHIPLEALGVLSRIGLLPLLMSAAMLATMLFLFLPGLERRMGGLYLPVALAMAILTFSLESGVAYLRPGGHLLLTLPSGQTISLFWASTEMILMALIPCVLAGAAYGVRGAVKAATLASLLHLALGVLVWLYGVPLGIFLALLPLRLGVLYVFPFIAGYLADTWRREHVALQEANRQLRGYAATVEHLATSRERVRLARDMHDILAHSLSAVVVQLEAVDTLHETDLGAARQQLAKVQQQARVGLDEVRRAILNLRSAPVEELGLGGAIEQLVERFGQRNGILTNWAMEGEPVPLLPVQANALYRMAEEALSNVERHAEASHLTVCLRYADGVTLSVQDDGLGFDPETVDPDRYGLVGIRERAALVDAQVTVDSVPNEGTTLTVRIVEPWQD
ncbi:MAG: sensor histidine kinase [Anaerolineae bacterium]|nr:MAG: sensor histidine kinase [Anaerolineae bacterium]